MPPRPSSRITSYCGWLTSSGGRVLPDWETPTESFEEASLPRIDDCLSETLERDRSSDTSSTSVLVRGAGRAGCGWADWGWGCAWRRRPTKLSPDNSATCCRQGAHCSRCWLTVPATVSSSFPKPYDTSVSSAGWSAAEDSMEL